MGKISFFEKYITFIIFNKQQQRELQTGLSLFLFLHKILIQTGF